MAVLYNDPETQLLAWRLDEHALRARLEIRRQLGPRRDRGTRPLPGPFAPSATSCCAGGGGWPSTATWRGRSTSPGRSPRTW